MDKGHQKPLSIGQAINFIKEKSANVENDAKQEALKNPISTADVKDRIKYLQYGISLLNDVSPAIQHALCKAGLNRELYSGRELARMLKALMNLKIHGYTNAAIGRSFGVDENTVKNLEIVALEAIKTEIERRNIKQIPIFGGLPS